MLSRRAFVERGSLAVGALAAMSLHAARAAMREEMRAHLARTAEDIEAAIGEGGLDAGELRQKEGV